MNPREKYLRDLAKEKGWSAEKTDKIVAKAMAEDVDQETKDLLELVDLPLGRVADYNRSKDDLKAKAGQLEAWKGQVEQTVTQHVTRVRELESIIKKAEDKVGPLDQIIDRGDGTGVGKDGTVVDMKAVKEIIQAESDARDGYYLALMADQNAIIAQHARNFKGEIIDTTPLLKYVAAALKDPTNPRSISLVDAYNEVNKERIDQLNTETKAAEEKRLRDEGAAEERKRLMKAGYRPTGANVSETSSVYETEPKKADPDRQRDPEENINLFTQDLATELAKRDIQPDV